MSENQSPKHRIGLALSGGGYRAAAFHLGTLRALHKLRILDKVEVLSTVSGGSIVGADYVLSLSSARYPDFEQRFIEKLKESVVSQVLASFTFIKVLVGAALWLGAIIAMQFTLYPWVSWIVLIVGILLFVKYQFRILPISTIIEGVYDRIFFNGRALRYLPDKPVIAINSTNVETGRQFTFSKNRMGDSTYDHPEHGDPIKFKPTEFPVSRAVMASSCVPFAFSPVPIAEQYFVNAGDFHRVHPLLIDGGVYDNQGMHKLTFDGSGYSCDVVITSDAGNKMPFEGSFKNVFTLLIRSMDLFMNRIKKSQMMDNLYQPGQSRRQIAFVSLGWDLDRCIPGFVENLKEGIVQREVIEAHQIPLAYMVPFDAPKIQAYLEQQIGYAEIRKGQQSPQDLAIARKVGTNLTALSDQQIRALINQAELMTELQVRLYCPAAVGEGV